MKLSVVIGTYNQRHVLRKALESLFHQTLSPEMYEILLVDSSSIDGTDKMIEELQPTCRFDYLRVENHGKAAARNFGIKKARGEIILLTDADMIANERLLEEHLLAHAKKINGSFEGLTINPDGKPYIHARLRALQKIKWSYFLTGNLSIRKNTLIEAGLFDEQFKGYGWEDIELGYRLCQMKTPLFYLPSAVNFHDHPVTKEAMVKRKFDMGESAALFYLKHPNFGIKMFIGMNPLAMAIFHFLKKRPSLLEYIQRKINTFPFFQYIFEEYQYRLGLEEGLSKK